MMQVSTRIPSYYRGSPQTWKFDAPTTADTSQATVCPVFQYACEDEISIHYCISPCTPPLPDSPDPNLNVFCLATGRGALHTPYCNCIFHRICDVGSVKSRRLLACNFERIFERWNFTVLTRICRRSAISLFESRLRTSSRISSSRGVVACRSSSLRSTLLTSRRNSRSTSWGTHS